MRDVMAMVLAGGRGSRLSPLTDHRAKPATPFAGQYRIIDFTLSNCINSNIRKVAVMTQYKSFSLDRHLRLGWNMFDSESGDYIIAVPPQQRVSKDWYRGTADAVYQNFYMLDFELPNHIFVLAGDHIYKMDYSLMYKQHIEKNADVTIGVIEVPKSSCSSFGVARMDEEGRVVEFHEKPETPPEGSSDEVFASMGIYLFNREPLFEALTIDSVRDSEHDFGKNIIPDIIKDKRVFGYNFVDENKKQKKYWRDVGTIDAYWEAHMDVVAVDPMLNLYERDWPIRTFQRIHPPAKFVFAQDHDGGRRGTALDSIVCSGSIISGGQVVKSVLSPNTRVNSYSEVTESIIFSNVEIGRYSKIRKTIIERGIKVPPKTEIGYDLEADKKRFSVSESGVVVVTRDMKF